MHFLMVAGVGAQFIYPSCTMAAFGCALSMMVLYLGIQSPEEVLDKQLGIFNKASFVQKANISFKAKNEFQIVSISIRDWTFLEKTFGVTAIEMFLEIFVRDIKNVCSLYHMEMYRIDESNFYVMIHNKKKSADELAKDLYELCNKNWECGYVEIPASVDVCVIKCPQDFEKVDDILQCTDYIANDRTQTNSRIVYAKDVTSGYGKRRNDIRHAIHKAILNNSFKVYYQPIYSTKNDRILPAEALVRLIDDDMGFIPPDEFILNKYGLNPEQLNLEVTETAASNSADVLNCNMQNLVEKGIAFSLDDYGTGYSNINYIINLPFHLIKMDKNIVWSAFANRKAGTVLESSVSMIQKLDLKIVAEGVETKEQMEALTAMGCEYLQGYYFSKPLPEKEFLEFILEFNKQYIDNYK